MKRKAPLRSRTRLARGGYLNRKTPLRPGKPLRPVNPERKAKLRKRQYGDAAAKIREMPCLVDGCCVRPVHPAHVRSRGAGGDETDQVPLCWLHHGEQHQVGIATFEARYGLDLAAEAERVAAEITA